VEWEGVSAGKPVVGGCFFPALFPPPPPLPGTGFLFPVPGPPPPFKVVDSVSNITALSGAGSLSSCLRLQ